MEYIALVLMSAWSAGCVVLPLYGARHFAFTRDSYDRSVGMALGFLLLGTPIGVLAAGLPWAVREDMRSPDLATLKKSQWECTAWLGRYTPPTYVQTGKVMVPVGGGETKECTQYNRKGER